jgi:hypothetical protein
VYVAALWGPVDFLLTGAALPLAATMSTSTNGGGIWTTNPWSQNIPLIDRQWIASYKDNQVYLSYQQLGVDLVGTNSIFCLKSFDGGLTFPQVTEVTTPEFGVQPGFQGNIAVDPSNGYVYTVFIGHLPNELYLARSTDGGSTFIIKLVYAAPLGTAVSNVFPIVAVDHGSNVHIVFSDGSNVYLTSSSNQGATWSAPLRVNNGVGTKSAIAPWIDAGDAGKVDIMWWATSSTNTLSDSAKWQVYFAQTQNALAKTPTITENAATGVFHTGPICVNGTGCAAGTRNLAEYASTTVYLDGKAMIVYPDDQQSSPPQTYFIKQTGGSIVTSTAARTSTQPNHVQESHSTVPDRYVLQQNYPNPFNPSTIINYDLASTGYTQLKVYNVLGEEVASLIDKVQDAGSYSIRFDASRLSSGIYFYKLVAGKFVDVKRLMILK